MKRGNEMPARCFLTTFHPLVITAAGRTAVQRYNLPPFIDGSCRREPDFESRFPSISALCRVDKFAPRLKIGDRAAYLTVCRKYPGDEMVGWRLVAILRVAHDPFADHREAAQWYAEQGCPTPSNCLVPGNPPKAFDHTHGELPDEVRRNPRVDTDRLKTRLWDCGYWERARKQPVFLATEVEFLDLVQPPQLQKGDMVDVFGKVPGTQTPKEIDRGQLRSLLDIATKRERS